MNIRLRDRLVCGAANGMLVWMWYAAIEYLFSTAAPMLIHREKVIDEAQWRGTVILFFCYTVWGILTGLGAALSMDGARNLAPAEFDRRNRKFLILLLITVFGVNLALLPAQPGKVAALLAVSLVAAAVIFNVGKSGPDLGLSASPWAIAATLVLCGRVAFVNFRNFSAWIAIPLILAVAAATLAAAVLAIRLALRMRSSSFWSPVMEHTVIGATVIAMIFGPGAVSSVRAEISTRPVRTAPARRPGPNVILITMDTVRADHMGIYGYGRQDTPNLKELLKDSTLYTNFIAASTLTLTSHASMFTGLYPQSHGAYKQFPDFPTGRPLAAGTPTIASILGASGYRSMALGANSWYLVPDWGLLQGFQYAWTPYSIPLVEANHPYLLRRHIREVLRSQAIMSDFYSSPAVDASTITGRAVGMIDRLGGQPAPFFLFLNYMDAHWPYHSPDPYGNAYPGQDLQSFRGDDDEAWLRTQVDCHGEAVPAGYQTHSEAQYDGAIAFIDFKIGELVQNLKENGLYEKTMIIITSDHGEGFGDRGYLGHNVSVYQDQVHVPLVIKYPGGRGSERVDSLASHVDLLPTILEVAGLAPRPDLPGTSLLHLNTKPDRMILSERHYGPCMDKNSRIPGVQYAVFQGSSKMISSSLGVQELYDLANDPNEKTNLYRTAAPPTLETALQDWIRRTPKLSAAQQSIAPDQLKRLRSLGYLQ